MRRLRDFQGPPPAPPALARGASLGAWALLQTVGPAAVQGLSGAIAAVSAEPVPGHSASFPDSFSPASLQLRASHPWRPRLLSLSLSDVISADLPRPPLSAPGPMSPPPAPGSLGGLHPPGLLHSPGLSSGPRSSPQEDGSQAPARPTLCSAGAHPTPAVLVLMHRPAGSWPRVRLAVPVPAWTASGRGPHCRIPGAPRWLPCLLNALPTGPSTLLSHLVWTQQAAEGEKNRPPGHRHTCTGPVRGHRAPTGSGSRWPLSWTLSRSLPGLHRPHIASCSSGSCIRS